MNSKLKTWLRRNGFRCEANQPMRSCKGYVERSGRKFRIRPFDGVVDIGETFDTFDRWANSTERTISLDEFKQEFSK